MEVPKPNYLLNKQLTNKELKNAWRTFEHSGIRNYQPENEESSNQQQADEHQTGGYTVVIDQPNSKIAKIKPIRQLDPNQADQINLMQPSVIYQRYDKLDQNYDQKAQDDSDEDLDEDETINEYSKDDYTSKDDFQDELKNGDKDSLRKSYKQDNSVTKQIAMPKRRFSARRKGSARKVFYDYE